MRAKELLVVVLLVSAAFTQTVSIKDFLKAPQPKLPENCLEVNEKNECTKCVAGFDVAAGACVKAEVRTATVDVAANEDAPAPDKVPCGEDASCGEATNFKTQKEFQDFLDKYTQKQQPQYETMAFKQTINTFSTDFSAFPTEASGSASASLRPAPLPSVNPANDFSGTNNQVNGVDEADLLKTDGTYIYTISNQILSVILAYPSNQARVVSKLNFKDFNPSALFIEGDYLAVFGTKTEYFNGNCYPYYPLYAKGGVQPAVETLSVAPAVSTTSLRVADAPEVAAPSLTTARTAAPSLIAPQIYRPWPCYSYSTSYTYIKIYDMSNRGKPFLLKEFQVSGSYNNGRKLDNGFMYLVTSYSFNYLPKPYPWYNFGLGPRDVDVSSIFWYPGIYSNPTAVNIISFDLGNPLGRTKKVISICAEYTNIMYMSERFIYLTTSSYQNGEQYTKIRKIYVWGSYIKPFADGKVRGSVNNQFSLDEYGHFFRVATTTWESGDNSNNVFVLDYYLKPFGALTGIAKGERIFSARYVLRRLYLVTFRQVDPFFVISFKSHKKPVILGELKITGFSRYLHPYDETTIIGLGRQADKNGRQLGLKISLFDVSDVKNPVESANFEIEQKYASSNAEWEHKAFLFDAQRQLLVIPGNMDFNGTKFNGALAFYITKTQIILRSIIDHFLNPSDNFWQRNVERSLYINDLLYTKSQCLLRINKINKTFDGVKNINIPCDQKQFDPIIIKPLPIKPIKPWPPIQIDPLPIDIAGAV